MNKVLGNKKSIAVFVLPAFLIYAIFVLVPIGYNVYVSFLQTDLMSPSKFVGIKNYINLFQDKTFIYAIFVLVPIGYNVYVSFLQTDLMSPSKFVGIKNYINLFQDKTFIGAVKNNILMVIGSLIAHLPLALFFGNILFQKIKGSHFFQTVFFLPSVICGVAVGSLIAHLPLALFFGNILFQKIKGSHFFQTVFFLPSVICGVAVGLTWTFVYNSEFGLINKFLEMIGLGSLKQVWLADKNLALFCIIIVVMWQFVGYHMIIQIAAMKNISESYYEAAEIDCGNEKYIRVLL